MTRRSLVKATGAAIIAGSFQSVAQDARTFRADVKLVEVYATVFDSSGHFVDGLGRLSFRVLDDGQPQEIVYFEDTTEGFSCALLLDTTGSMDRVLPEVKSSVAKFIEKLGPKDSVALFTFDTRLSIRQGFTRDKASARKAVLRLRAGGSTALYDALAQTARQITARPGKKVIVVFTDGDDNSSALTAESAITHARRLGVPLYTIAEGEALQSSGLLRTLEDLSKRTGGVASRVRHASDIEGIFTSIAEDLQHTYLIAYNSPAPSGSRWRRIQLSIPGSNEFKVRAKEGYNPE